MSPPPLHSLTHTHALLPPHPPRPAAGKTYANCFLRSALPPSKRCAKSYDVLRYNVSADSCRTIVSHDDFSVSQFLPPEAATITQLRRWGGWSSDWIHLRVNYPPSHPLLPTPAFPP